MSTPLPPLEDTDMIIDSMVKLKDDGSNFWSWKIRMNLVFQMGGVLQVVEGKEKAPTEGKAERHLWEEKCFRITYHWGQSMSPSQFEALVQLSPNEAWNELKRKFDWSKEETYSFVFNSI
ncbi:hypothetical protein JCM3765_005199 [Sporobolomyces pararoseus]